MQKTQITICDKAEYKVFCEVPEMFRAIENLCYVLDAKLLSTKEDNNSLLSAIRFIAERVGTELNELSTKYRIGILV